MIRVRLARYRDKIDVNCKRYPQEGFPEGDPLVVVNISTGGKWCYHAWVEGGVFEESPLGVDAEDNCGTEGIYRFRPEAHEIEVAERLIIFPESIEKLAEIFNLYDPENLQVPKGITNEFLLQLKLMLLRTWALGFSDFEAITFLEDEDKPTPLFESK